jgi:hypothetical protein
VEVEYANDLVKPIKDEISIGAPMMRAEVRQ